MSINTRSFLSTSLQLLLSLLILCAAVWGGFALYYQLPVQMPWLAVINLVE